MFFLQLVLFWIQKETGQNIFLFLDTLKILYGLKWCCHQPLSQSVSNEQGSIEGMEESPDKSLEALILENDINGNQRHIYVSDVYELWLGL